MKNNLKYEQKDLFSLRKLFFNLFYITLTPTPAPSKNLATQRL
jgi:hypothetical protein